ncbi:MAG: TolC family protein [Vulcanimicrobiota bacterium]
MNVLLRPGGALILGWLLAGSAGPQSLEEVVRQTFAEQREVERPQSPLPEGVLNLSVAQALQLGLSGNPDYRAAVSRSRQSYWRYQASTALPRASLALGTQSGYGIGYINTTFSGVGGYDNYLLFSQPVGTLGARVTERQIAVQEVAGSLQDEQQFRLDTIRQVKDAYFNAVAARLRLQVAQQNSRLSQELLEIAQRRLKAGVGPEVDALNAEIQLRRSLQDERSARAGLLIQLAQLKPWLGLEPGASLNCLDDFEAPVEPPTLEQALAAVESHPRLVSARLQQKKSELRTTRLSQENNPSLSTNGFYSFVTKSYGVNLSLAIPVDWGEIRNGVEESLEQQNEQAQALKKAVLGLRAEIAQNLENYQTSLANSSEFGEKILAPQEKTLKVYQRGYSVGVVSYLQVLSIQQQVVAARQDLVDRQLTTQLARNGLEASLGRGLEGAETVR